MPRSIVALCLLGLAALCACSPTFNWREIRVEPTPLRVMLPCKPDKGARPVSMAGRDVSLEVLGCDTGGATFAVLFADLGDASRAGDALGQWKAATLLNLHSEGAQERSFQPPGALGLSQSQLVAARGRRADGSQVDSQAAYFARGSQVFQAVIYSGKLEPQVADTFFSGLKFE